MLKWTLTANLPQPLPVTESSWLQYPASYPELSTQGWSPSSATLSYISQLFCLGCSLGLLVFWLAPGCLAPRGSLLSPLPSSYSSAGHVHPEFFQMPLPLPVLSLLSIIKKLNPLGAIKSSSYLFSSLSGEECCEFCLQDMTGLSHSRTHRSYGYLFKAWVRTNHQKSLRRWGRTLLLRSYGQLVVSEGGVGSTTGRVFIYSGWLHTLVHMSALAGFNGLKSADMKLEGCSDILFML